MFHSSTSLSCVNNTWAPINKLHKHPRRRRSLGLVPTDPAGDEEIMELDCAMLNSCACVSEGVRKSQTHAELEIRI